jgi:hypothetical protein
MKRKDYRRAAEAQRQEEAKEALKGITQSG